MTSFQSSRMKVERRGFTAPAKPLKPLPALPRTLMRDVDVDLVLSAGDRPLPPPPPPQREPAARERPATAGQRRTRGARGGGGGGGGGGGEAPSPSDGNNKQSRERFLALSLINARVDTILEGYEDAPGSPGGTAGGGSGGGGGGGGSGGGGGGAGPSGSPTTQLEPLSLRTHTQGQYASQAEQSQDLLQGLLRRVGIVEGKVSATRLGYTLEHMFEELRQGLTELGETAAEGLRSREASLEEIAELRRRVDVLQEREARAAREAEEAPTRARPATCVTLAHAEVRGRGLWTRNPELMREACAVFVAVCRRLAEEHSGVEVLCEGDTVAMAFQSPADGAGWALGLQRGLLAAAWPAELSDANASHPGCGVVRDKDGRLMWRGLRVGTGMHQGQAGAGGVGPLASVCAKLAARARGGETLVHAAVHEALQEMRIPDAFSAPAHPSAKAEAAFCYAPEELRGRVYKENALDRDAATLEMWKADRERKMQVKQDAIDKAEADLAAAAKPACFVSIGVSAVAHVTLEHCVPLWKLDPERASDVLQTCKEKVEELCTGHGGRLLRGEYDRFLLIFDRVDVALLFGTELHRMLTTVNIVWAKACDAAEEEPGEADAAAGAAAAAAAPDEMLCSVVVTECKTVRQTADCLSDADIALLADAAAARRGGDTLLTQAAHESATRGRLSHIAVEPLCSTPAGHKLYLAYATEDGAAHRERLAAQPCLGPFQGLRGYLSDLKQRLAHERSALADAAAAAAAAASPKGKKKPVGGVPPAGDVWLTHAAIQNCTGLWAHDLPAMEAARRLTTNRLRRAAEAHGGYEVSSGCAYLAAFPSAEAALAFAVRAQCELLEEAWPAGILSHADARPAKVEGRLVWAGPRVRMCISGGAGVRGEENSATGRMEYYGAPVSAGEKLVRVTHGGLIAVPLELFERLDEAARVSVVVAAEKAVAVAGVARPVALCCVVPRALAAREFPCDTPEEAGLESRVQRAVLRLTEEVAVPPPLPAASGKVPTARSVEVPFDSSPRAPPSELTRLAASSEQRQQQQRQQTTSPHPRQEKQRLASLETSPSPSPRTSITWVGDPRRSKTGATSPLSGDRRSSDPLDDSRRSSGASEVESEDTDMPDAVGQGAMATVEQWSRMMLVRAEANRLDDDELHTSLEKMEALEEVFTKVRTADCVVRRLKQKTPRSTRSKRDRAPERREKLERGATERMAEDEESRDSTPEERLETMRRRLVNVHKMTRVFYVQTAQYFAGMSGNFDMERITEDEFMIRWLKLLRRMDKDEGEQKKVGQGTTRSAFTETMKFAVDMEAEEERHCSLGNYGVLYRSCPSLFCKTFNAMRTYFKQAGKGTRGGGMADVARRSVSVRSGHQALSGGNQMAKRMSRASTGEPKGGAGSDLLGS